MTGSNIDAYFAGLIDGEGSIRIRKTLRRRQPSYIESVDVGMVNSKDILELAKTIYGGSTIYQIKNQFNRKPIYRWTVAGKIASRFLRRIYPYLILKKNQAEICFKLRNLIEKNELLRKPNGTYLQLNEQEVANREGLFVTLKELHL